MHTTLSASYRSHWPQRLEASRLRRWYCCTCGALWVLVSRRSAGGPDLGDRHECAQAQIYTIRQIMVEAFAKQGNDVSQPHVLQCIDLNYRGSTAECCRKAVGFKRRAECYWSRGAKQATIRASVIWIVIITRRDGRNPTYHLLALLRLSRPCMCLHICRGCRSDGGLLRGVPSGLVAAIDRKKWSGGVRSKEFIGTLCIPGRLRPGVTTRFESHACLAFCLACRVVVFWKVCINRRPIALLEHGWAALITPGRHETNERLGGGWFSRSGGLVASGVEMEIFPPSGYAECGVPCCREAPGGAGSLTISAAEVPWLRGVRHQDTFCS